jgi:hypothetical protein
MPDLCRLLLSEQFIQELADQKIIVAGMKETTTKDEDGEGHLLHDLLEDGDLRKRLVPQEQQKNGQEGGDDAAQLAYETAGELMKVVREATEQRISARMALEDKDKAELYQTINKYKALLTVKRYNFHSIS